MGVKEEDNANIRRYNNLIKVLLLEQFVDTLSLGVPLCVLDIGCGHGQDIQKYSRSFRSVSVQKYVGLDFASAAIAEAKQRHAALLSRAGSDDKDYTAVFYAGDFREADTFRRTCRTLPGRL